MATKINKSGIENTKAGRGPTGKAALALVLACGLLTGATAANAENYYALVVGIDQYSPAYGAGALQACVPDANSMVSALTADNTRWNPNNIIFLTNAQATKDAIRQALRTLASTAGPGDVCIYFQSSHGGQRQGTDTFLCTHDADFSDQELGQELAGFNAQTRAVVIIDACFSGGLFKGDDQGRESLAPQAAQWSFAQNALASMQQARMKQAASFSDSETRDPGANVGFITACDYNQTSQESNGHGVFTRHLLGAFQDTAADTNSNQVLSFWELFSWAAPRATQENPQQTAQSFNAGLLESTTASAAGKYDGSSGVSSNEIPSGDDSFEENDTSDQAAGILESGTLNLVCADEDWFALNTGIGTLSVRVNSNGGDLDLYVLDESGSVVGQSITTSSNESVEVKVESGQFYVVVVPYQNQGGSYTMSVDVPVFYDAVIGGDGLCGALGSAAPMMLGASLIGLVGLSGMTHRRRAR